MNRKFWTLFFLVSMIVIAVDVWERRSSSTSISESEVAMGLKKPTTISAAKPIYNFAICGEVQRKTPATDKYPLVLKLKQFRAPVSLPGSITGAPIIVGATYRFQQIEGGTAVIWTESCD